MGRLGAKRHKTGPCKEEAKPVAITVPPDCLHVDGAPYPVQHTGQPPVHQMIVISDMQHESVQVCFGMPLLSPLPCLCGLDLQAASWRAAARSCAMQQHLQPLLGSRYILQRSGRAGLSQGCAHST